jgi:hypothetical protein
MADMADNSIHTFSSHRPSSHYYNGLSTITTATTPPFSGSLAFDAPLRNTPFRRFTPSISPSPPFPISSYPSASSSSSGIPQSAAAHGLTQAAAAHGLTQSVATSTSSSSSLPDTATVGAADNIALINDANVLLLQSPPKLSRSTGKPPTLPRSRAKVACQRCKQKHLACSGERPCLNCIKKHVEHECCDADRKRAGRPPGRKNKLRSFVCLVHG